MYTPENIAQMRDYLDELMDEFEQYAPEQYYKSSLITDINDLYKEIDGEA